MRRIAVPAWGVASLVCIGHPLAANADVVLDWNSIAVHATKDAALGPNPQSRALAIVHLAVHDAVAAVVPRYAPFHARPGLSSPASAEAAVAAAAYGTLLGLFPSQKASLDDALAFSLKAIADDAAKTNGVAVGSAAASDILSVREGDGSSAAEVWPSGSSPGVWREVPPGNRAVQPWWRKVKPFALDRPEQFRSPAPPTLDSAVYGASLAQVASLGRGNSAQRTPEQTAIALFWNDSPVTLPNAAARQVSAARHLDVAEEARLFALLNSALADAQIAASDGQFTYNLWRPVSAINDAPVNDDVVDASDGDSASPSPAASWAPLLDENTSPDYPSGPATTVAAGLGLLELYFGDDVSFTLASASSPDRTRTFASFSQASSESARSRYYGGSNFAFSAVAGEDLGAKVARKTYVDLLPFAPPVDAPIEAGIADASATEGGGDEAVDALSTNEGGRDRGRADGAAEASAVVPLVPDDFDSGCSMARPGGRASVGLSSIAVALAIVSGSRRRRRAQRLPG